MMFLSFSAARLPSLTGEGERALLGDSARPAAESCTTAAACTLAQTVVTSYIAKHHVNVIEHCRQTQTNSMVAVLTNAEKHVRVGDSAFLLLLAHIRACIPRSRALGLQRTMLQRSSSTQVEV